MYHRQVILASGSPRRRMLLEQCGFEPIVVKSSIPEEISPLETPYQYTRRLAEQKVRSVVTDVAQKYPQVRFIIGADTVVVCDDELLEKPSDELEAVSMLSRLSGRAHTVITSFAVLDRLFFKEEGGIVEGGLVVETRMPKVLFRTLSEQMIENYVKTGDPMDKAGAYGIQSVGASFVDSVEGSFFAVVGLPIADVVATLDQCLKDEGGLSDYPFVR